MYFITKYKCNNIPANHLVRVIYILSTVNSFQVEDAYNYNNIAWYMERDLIPINYFSIPILTHEIEKQLIGNDLYNHII